ncbi:MAG: COG1470 family protein [Candidatus Helarchaeota archaeon]
MIPIYISISRSSSESPRVVPIRIVISNTVVDFNSIGLVSVRPYHQVELLVTPETQVIEPEETATYTIDVRNLGNVRDTYDIYLEGQVPNSMIELEKDQITLEPNELVSITIDGVILENWTSMEDQTYGLLLAVISSDQVTKNSSTFELTVMTTPKHMMLYIISEIAELQDEINDTLNGTIKNIISYQLAGANIRLNESIEEHENDNYANAIILDKLAKVNLLISEIIVWIGDFIN